MSNSRHPVALRLERSVGGATRLLATVMVLPLVDGIFAALVLAGALSTVGGILQVGLLVFGGSATAAVVLAEMGENPRSQVGAIALVGTVLVVLAAFEAAIAPTLESVLVLGTFERFAALVLLAVAAKTGSARIGDLLPRPAVIVGLGLLASVDLSNPQLVVAVDPDLVLRAVAAAGIGVAFALTLALLAPTLRGIVDLDRFRFGSAVALGVLPLSILGVVPGNAPLAVLAIAALLAYDPAGLPGTDDLSDVDAPLADGGGDALDATTGSSSAEREDDDESEDRRGTWESTERAPWL